MRLAGLCLWLTLGGLCPFSVRGEETVLAAKPAIADDAELANARAVHDEPAVPAEMNVFVFDGQQQVQINGVVLQMNGAALQLNLLPQFGIAGQVDYVEHLRPLLISELAFVRQICVDMTIEDRRKIKIAGELALRAAAKKMAEIQPAENARGRFRGRRAGR